MTQFFPIPRIEAAIEHLQEFDSKWILVPLVFAANGVGEEEPVRIQGSGQVGTDAFLDKYFNGKLIGLPEFPNRANSMRPRFREIWSEGEPNYVVHQRQKLWGSQYSRNGYNIMRDRGLLGDHGSSTWQIDPAFWQAWEDAVPTAFRFEELLVWLFAFSGFADSVTSWQALSTQFQEQTVGTGRRFPLGYERRFGVSGEVDWPDDLLSDRPSDEDFQTALLPGLVAPLRDDEWLRSRFDEWRRDSDYPSDSDNQDLEMRDKFATLLAQESLRADPSSFNLPLFRQLLAGNYGGPGPQPHINRFLQQEGEAGVARLLAALDHVLYGEGELAQRIDDATGDPKWQVTGLRESVITKCLAIVYPDRWLPLFTYRSAVGKGKQDILQVLDVDLESGESMSIGEAAIASNDRLRERTEPLLPGDAWGQGVFLWWLRQWGGDSTAMESELSIDQGWIEEVAELLDDKLQVIFYGPPGTGKTFVAQRFAEWYADKGRVVLVQFHPSYGYEDFVQGYRPVHEDGAVRFELKPGPLMELAEEARESGDLCVLVIDEINRGNIAKIFGELYFLLEYRGEEIKLQYGGAFELPENLAIIGTMNTADRSIALLDAALRRRFHFVPFFPDEPPIDGVLRRWLEEHKPEMSYVADILEEANALLDDRDYQIGPAHFMSHKLDERWLGMIWQYSVMPYLEEHFFDEPERLDDFALDHLSTLVQTRQAAGETEIENGEVSGGTEPEPTTG